MKEIKAIETKYKGYLFRSRLEARWAVFFDSIGIKYQYEADGFEAVYDYADKKEVIRYLPDFYLPEFDCYVEVKGTDEALKKDGHKLAGAIDWNSTPVSKGLLILGNIPDPERITPLNPPMFSYLFCDRGINHQYAAFFPNYENKVKLIVGGRNIFDRIYDVADYDFSCFEGEGTIPESTSTECTWLSEEISVWVSRKFVMTLKEAFAKARAARFEFGKEG